MIYGSRLRRFTEHKPTGSPNVLARDHVAAVTAHTRYPAMVRDAASENNILKSGHHQRKIGARVMKGAWIGMPIYTLTLEERATCPTTCSHWFDCYGNKMHWSRRLKHGGKLETLLRAELAMYQHLHPRGFVVRLHILGDFYSVAYVELWRQWLAAFPALRIFGYTSWQNGTPIGDAVVAIRNAQWDRFAVRTSDGIGAFRNTVSIDSEREAGDAIVCPAQTDKTECCSTCALCWGTQRNITFLRH